MIKIFRSKWFYCGLGVAGILILAGILLFFRPPAGKPGLRLARVEGPVGKLDPETLGRLGPALEKNLAYLERLPPERIFSCGGQSYTAAQIAEAQLKLLGFLSRQPEPAALDDYLRRHFALFEVIKPNDREPSGPGPVLFTGYYVPILHGSRTPDKRFRFPLYRKPADLVLIETGRFNLVRHVRRLWPWIDRLPLIPHFDKLHFPRLRGRLTKEGRVVPYYDREAIDYQGKLEGKGLELLWVDDEVDRFFLQVQGSGQVLMPDGSRVMVGYAAANGHPYRSIGRWLIHQGLMRREEVSMPAIRKWIRNHPERAAEIFKVNPSYVFFRELPTPEPLGCYQVPLTAGVSIATDRKVFPGGVLGLVELELPRFSATGQLLEWRRCRRLVLNQDTGGAIRGPFRVDLFCGADRKAELTAGILKQPGRLFLPLPRTSRPGP